MRFSTSRAKLLLFESLFNLLEIEKEKVFYYYLSLISMYARFSSCTRLCILFLIAIKIKLSRLSRTLQVVRDFYNI